MKILDEKGRLWGKINLIDLIVILVLILIVIILARFFLLKDTDKTKTETYLVTIAPFSNSAWFFDAIQPGDVELDQRNNKIARIVHVDGKKNQVYVQIIAEKVKEEIVFKGRKIKINSRIWIETEQVMIEGIIIKIQTGLKPEQYRASLATKLSTVTVLLRLYEKDPWFIDAVQEGDTEVIQSGDQTFKIAKIVKKESHPSRIISVRSGKVQEVAHPNKKDLLLTIELICEQENDTLLFKEQKIKRGAEITIETKKIVIQGEIIHVGSAETDI